jgi:hypothetical protein
MIQYFDNTFTNIFKTFSQQKPLSQPQPFFTTNTQQLYLQRIQRRERLCLVAVRHPTNRVQFASLVATVKGFKTLPTTGAAADGYLW